MITKDLVPQRVPDPSWSPGTRPRADLSPGPGPG